MKNIEFLEGREAMENFEEGMKALFKVPKEQVVKAEKREKRKRDARASTVRKPKRSDGD